jgi:xanthine dehydrogenase accessory factor
MTKMAHIPIPCGIGRYLLSHMGFWEDLLTELRAGRQVMLLQVVESMGSSPGRAGFRMYINSEGGMFGSIGGGSMEHKLVELAASMLRKGDLRPLIKRQIHRTDVPAERSGMICSGEQTVAFIPVDVGDSPAIEAIIDHLGRKDPVRLIMDERGLRIGIGQASEMRKFTPGPESGWRYEETLGQPDRVLIFGGGHVGLALSEVLDFLGYEVHVIDDRPGLNTMESNNWAHQKSIIDYAEAGAVIEDDPDLFVVLASFGYRTDEQILRQLIRKRFRYLGMLGSVEKVRKMFDGMRADGFTDDELARVQAPIGLPINSRTPQEIAVSIAAQIIQIRNA